MKTKSNLKMFLVVGILLVTMCVICTNTVNATNVLENNTTTQSTKTDDTTKVSLTDPKEIIKLIPDTMNVNILESQFITDNSFTAEELVNKQIDTILKTNNIDLKTLKAECYAVWGSENIHKLTIFITNEEHKTLAEKEINIKYSNTDTYNTTDEEYVKNKIKNIDFNLVTTVEMGNEFNGDPDTILPKAQKIYEQLINDKNITFYFDANGFGSGDFMQIGSNIYIFKNNVLYAKKDASYLIGNMVTVPNNIQDTDKEYINYALPKVAEFYKNANGWGNNVKVELKKTNTATITINDNITIKNNGTFYMVTKDGEDWANIQIKKADTKKVIDYVTISGNSNVSITGTILDNNNSAYTEMLEKVKAKGYSNIFCAYELKSSNNIKDGLTITFSLGTDNNGKQAIVLHKKADGSYEEFIKTVENGKIEITVTELSPFMVALNGNRTLDDEPKTGAENYVLFTSAIALLSIGGLAVLKFKKQ